MHVSEMPRFEVLNTEIESLKIINRKVIGDHRGSLTRLFCQESFMELGFDNNVNQINLTLTKQKGTIRGMHFQYPPFAEIKLVSCLQGEVFDVAIDLREGSPTFLHWHAEILNAKNKKSLFIPKGFAHGFQTLVGDCELLYIHSASYVENAEGALNAMDPALAISWPLPVSDMSERDRSHSMVDNKFTGIKK